VRHIPRSRFAVGLAALATVAGLLAVPGISSAAPDVKDAGPGCQFQDLTVPASVVEQQILPLPVAGLLAGGDMTIHGRLCLPEGGAPETVMLALHGITYTNTYWNSGFEPETYNFSRAMTDAGYAVFAIDRLGYGESSHPPAELVTLDAQAEVAHQVIGQLRDGTVGGEAFEKVVLVGHSYGTAITWRETAKYNDADALIGTGWGNTIQTLPLARFFSGFYPAQLDAKFADKGLPPGYLTPLPGGRNQNFLYDLSNVDPAMIQYDQDVLRDTVTDGEGVTFYNRYGAIPVTYVPTTSEELELPLSAQTKDIHIPTFQVNGANELFFCGIDPEPLHQQPEAAAVGGQVLLRGRLLPRRGHPARGARPQPAAQRALHLREHRDLRGRGARTRRREPGQLQGVLR
jgi:Predicted hydrolases or acyltransferases (alpha/beta hydrolase superfamily)